MVRFPRRRRDRSLEQTAADPLLSVDRLTVRFGGLVAVADLDLDVEQGAIASLIGPNGAGKTTAFNCISGINRPTRGTVRLDGRRVARPFTPRVFWGILAVGLLTGLLVAAAAVDIDGLWLAIIKRPVAAGEPPTVATLSRRLRSYFRWELAVDRLGGSWRVVTPDGREVVAIRRSREEARGLRDALQAAITARRAGPGTVPEATDFGDAADAVHTVDGEVLDRLAAGKQAIRLRGWTALAVGWLVGAAGGYAVWRRGRRSPEVVAAAGIARTFQNIRLFAGLTVLENVRVGLDWGHRGSRRIDDPERVATEILAKVGLAGEAGRRAGELAYGDRRRLEIARALATRPRLLLLDEPTAGMNPAETAAVAELIRQIRDSGVTVLLIEHHMQTVMRVSDRVSVLDHGLKIAEGTPREIRRDERVINAYLGEAEA